RHLAERHGLIVEPGRLVLELRPPGMDKGVALTEYVRETGATAVLYAGDDLGDLAAFAAVERLRSQGVPGVLVCSGSTEVTELAQRADLVVDGPAGVVDLLTSLARAIGH
ncbi:trehalose-phosphatase, partial [Streptomyces sp. 2MCAF27]